MFCGHISDVNTVIIYRPQSHDTVQFFLILLNVLMLIALAIEIVTSFYANRALQESEFEIWCALGATAIVQLHQHSLESGHRDSI